MKKLFLFLSLCFCLYGTAYSQNESDVLFKKGFKSFENRDYVTARKLMNQVVNMPTASPDMREVAADIIRRCDEHTVSAVVNSVVVSDVDLNFSADGDFKELNISSDVQWDIRTMPSWCKVVDKSRNYLKLWCDENPAKVYRSGQLVITSGNFDKSVYLYQDPGVEKKGRVFFRTKPYNAYLEASDGSSGFSSSPLVFGTGEYTVRISKDGYEVKDTVIVVSEVEEDMRIVDVELTPLFGKLAPTVISEDGKSLSEADFVIGKTTVDLSDLTNSHSFDDRESVVYYGLYKDGVIPLKPGGYDVTVSAPGFRTETRRINVEKGNVHSMDIILKSVMGRLLVRDVKDAEGGLVVIPELKLKAMVGDTLDIPIGEYQIEIHKDDYMLDGGVLDVEIEKGRLCVADASMTRMVDVLVSTEYGGERLLVNNKMVKRQEPVHRISLAEGQQYALEVVKDGYWHITKDISVSKEDTLFDFRNLRMEKVDTLRLKADEPNLLISLKRRGEKGGEDYAQGKETSAEFTPLAIPYGKYNIKLTRQNEVKKSRLTAYRGVLNFTGKKDKRYFRTWITTSLASMRFLGGSYTFLPKYTENMATLYTPFNVNVFEFPLCKGLSTSFAKGTMLYTAGLEMPSDLPENHYVKIMPAISTPLTNFDFRIGGGLGQYFDVSAAVSYAYYLQFDAICNKTKWIKNYTGVFDHYEGHDLFVGVELGTRLKYFNLYLRAGLQYMNGERRYCYYYQSENVSPDTATPTYVYKMSGLPVDKTMFVASVYFNLGGRGAKGQNILRVF